MKFLPTFSLTIFLINGLWSQNVAINTTGVVADPSSMLDISSSNTGLLVPRVALSSTTLAAPVLSPQTSLLVYNTATVSDVSPGYYYWDGAVWLRMTSSNDSWAITGNAGTSSISNFIGTTDAVDFVMRTNNVERMRISSNGKVGIGVNPSYKLDVNLVSAIPDDRALNINYTTSDNIGGLNSGIYVNTLSTGTADVFGIFSLTNSGTNNNSSAIAGIVNSSGIGDRIAIASQLSGTGNDGAGFSSSIIGSWTNAYGLYLDFTATSTFDNFGLYVKGTPTYSGFMENGIFYINDNVGIGMGAVTPSAKLHVDGNIKSSFLAGANDRMLYANNAGQITAMANGSIGDVLTINASNVPAWGPVSAGGKLYFQSLTSSFVCNTGVPTLLLSKTFIPFNDTVIVEFSLSGTVSTAGGATLTPFEVILEHNGAGFYGSGTSIHMAYGHPNSNAIGGKINISFSIPLECTLGSNTIDIYIHRFTGTGGITINPASLHNATLIIHDIPTN